jgi:chromosome segregation ATPase
MTKLAQDSYIQGALDFLKTASIDSDIGRTAFEVLIKESSKARSMPSLAEARSMTPLQMQEVTTARAEAPMLREEMKALKAEQAAAQGALRTEINAMRSGAAEQLKARQVLEGRLENVRGRLKDTRGWLSEEQALTQQLREAEAAAKSEMRKYRGQVSSLSTEMQALREAHQAEQAAARAALETEQRALATAGKENFLYKKLHRAAEADLRDAMARGKKLKGKALGLGGLAALGLGYMGYDQLSDSGVPSVFAETPPPAPEPGFLQRIGLAS